MIWNASGKVTAQFTPNHGLAFVYSYNSKNRYHRRPTTPAYVEEKATTIQEQPGYTISAKYTAVAGADSVFESNIGLIKGVYPERYQSDVQPTDIRREDLVLSTATGAAPSDYQNPNYRFQFDNVLTHNVTGLGGWHVLKAGVQFGRQFFQQVYRMNGDMRLIYNNGVATQVMAFNTPVDSKNYVHQIGFFGQDSWTIGQRLTLNVGLRVDRANGWYPEQVSAAGRWVPERQLARTDVYKQWAPAWRTGLTYDLFGNGRTAIKGDFSRYAHQVGIGLVTNVLPVTLSSANISWTDRNRNDLPEPDELGAFEGFTGAATSRYDNPNGPDWGHSDEITAGIEHQLMKDFSVSAMYYHRTNRKITGTRNNAVPTTAYTPFTIDNPLGGTLTVYNLDPAWLGKQDNVRAAVDLLNTDYDGMELTAIKRFSDRWQMQFGFTAGRNEGGLDQGDFNDPNSLQNQQGIVGDDATYQVKLSGAYIVPKLELNVSGSFIRNTGYPRQYTYSATRRMYPGLTRSTQTVYVNRRGDERLPTVMMIDLRLSRRFMLFRGVAFQPQVDLFNITNNDAIVSMVNAVGPRLGYPVEILAPRIIRVGFTVNF